MPNKKYCPYCGGPVVMLSSIDVKLCADCKKELPWVLSENETSIFGDRVATSKEVEAHKFASSKDCKLN